MRRVNVAVKARDRDNSDKTWDELRGYDSGGGLGNHSRGNGKPGFRRRGRLAMSSSYCSAITVRQMRVPGDQRMFLPLPGTRHG